MEVCIIGGGPCGIISAKVCQTNGFYPYILERKDTFGGLWRQKPNEISVWNSLYTNGDKFTSGFSDQWWGEEVPVFPKSTDAIEYFTKYIEKHSLQSYFHYNCIVTKVKIQDNGYLVRWNFGEDTIEKIFKYVIIANGLLNKRNIPVKNLDAFKGTIIHSADYRDPSIFINKKVVVVGNRISGCDICSDILNHASSVTQIFRTPIFLIRKVLDDIPHTFYLFNIRNILSRTKLFPTREDLRQKKAAFFQMFGNPKIYHPLFEIDETCLDGDAPASLADDNYLSALSENKITLIKGGVESVNSDGVVLDDGRIIEADAIILATGYFRSMDFLSKKIKTIIKYEENSKSLGMSLYRAVLHPDLPGLFISGNLQIPVDCKYEMHAEIAARWFLGTLNVTREELLEGVAGEDNMRAMADCNREGYSPFSYWNELIRMLNIEIDMNMVEKELDFKGGFLLLRLMYLDRPGMLEIVKDNIAEIKRKFPGFACGLD